MNKHIVQSETWGKIKSIIGTPSIRVGEIQYTKHKIPFTSFFYAYSPRVNPFEIGWEGLKQSLEDERCISINFDVPNGIKNTSEGDKAEKILDEKCKKAPRDTFAKYNILLNIKASEEDLLQNMHKKHRYNIRYAQKKGVKVYEGKTEADFDIFFELLKETSKRQKYFIHPKKYYKTIWEEFSKDGIVHILIATFEEKPLTAWMLFTYEGVLYYPYGGSSEKHKNLQHSILVGWETIKLGKKYGCEVFDMWGAGKDPADGTDPWSGFTNFKLKYGGKHIEYINSCDFVVNPFMYLVFNLANKIRWMLLKILK